MEFTNEETEVILQCANATWNECHDTLTNSQSLGDIEKKNLEWLKEKSRAIIKKITGE